MADSDLLIAYILGPVSATAAELAQALGLPLGGREPILVTDSRSPVPPAEDAPSPVLRVRPPSERSVTRSSPDLPDSGDSGDSGDSRELSHAPGSLNALPSLESPLPLAGEAPSPNLSRKRERGRRAPGQEGGSPAAQPSAIRDPSPGPRYVERPDPGVGLPPTIRLRNLTGRTRPEQNPAPALPVGSVSRKESLASGPSSSGEPVDVAAVTSAAHPEEPRTPPPEAVYRQPAAYSVPPPMAMNSQPSPAAFQSPDSVSPERPAPATTRPAAAAVGRLDPQQLEDALVEVLLATARRHGLEV